MSNQTNSVQVVPQSTVPSALFDALPDSSLKNLAAIYPWIREVAFAIKKKSHSEGDAVRILLAAAAFGTDPGRAFDDYYIVNEKVTPETPTLAQLVFNRYPEATFRFDEERCERSKVAVFLAGRTKAEVQEYRYTAQNLRDEDPSTKNQSKKTHTDRHLRWKAMREAFLFGFTELVSNSAMDIPEEEPLKENTVELRKADPPTLKKETLPPSDLDITEASGAPESIPEPVAGKKTPRPTPVKKSSARSRPRPKPTVATKAATPTKPKPAPKPSPTATPMEPGALDAAFLEMENSIGEYCDANGSDEDKSDFDGYARRLVAHALDLKEEALPENLDLLPIEHVRRVIERIEEWKIQISKS